MSLLGIASPQNLQTRWSNIIERYSKEVDEDSFNRFLKATKKDVSWNCDLAIMQAALVLASLDIEVGIIALKELGITGDSIAQLEQKIKGRITNHELKQAKVAEYSNDSVNFFSMLAKIRKMGYSIDSTILLQEWAGVLNDIKETDERNNTEG
jgi:hypothetical protein